MDQLWVQALFWGAVSGGAWQVVEGLSWRDYGSGACNKVAGFDMDGTLLRWNVPPGQGQYPSAIAHHERVAALAQAHRVPVNQAARPTPSLQASVVARGASPKGAAAARDEEDVGGADRGDDFEGEGARRVKHVHLRVRGFSSYTQWAMRLFQRSD